MFVDPTQFGLNEDLSTYTPDFLQDEGLCRDAGVAFHFAPDAQEVYPSHFETLH
ncbi:pantoate--beta-alanine ligase [Bradyrhizobium sp. BRP19]|uniref:pantoate--beta-alanine ligase n=1 Tax=Bradyrhizobium sp. BRP19 TaxID=2793823 RepID=UPI0034E2B0BC